MHNINVFGEKSGKKYEIDSQSITNRRYVDAYQSVIMSYISSHLFPWLCLVLILNRRQWRRPVIMILIVHWFLQATGDVFNRYLDFTDQDYYKKLGYDYPYNMENWYVSTVVARVSWISGEIIGDWYPLLRTKALVKNKGKMKPIYISCILYNIIKVMHILCDFVFTPSTFVKKKGEANKDLLKEKMVWWLIILLIQFVSLFYDISVMIALKNSLFDKLESLKNNSNSFIEKFKQISELRIFISIIISILFSPWPIVQVNYYIRRYLHPEKKTESITSQVEQLRSVVLRFVYTFMYIDQILLRFYVNKNISNGMSNDSSIDSQYLISPRQTLSNLIVSSSDSTSTVNSPNNNTLSLYKNNYNFEQGSIKSSTLHSNIIQYNSNNIESSHYM